MASLVKWLMFAGARDSAGDPVATGSAYFYVPDSESVEVTVYADPEETTPLSQPVTLDAAGRAKVYIKAPAEVLVKDSEGVTVKLATRGESTDDGTVDCTWNSTARSLDYVLTDVETNLGISAKYKESSTSGVVQRTYQAVVRQFISPYDFGCAGNGTTDDTTNLQKAINRAIATGLPLNLESGTYKITSGLTAAGIISIYGAGISKAIITTTATGLTGLSVVASSSYLRDFAIHVPYAGDTYDKALSITGSTCTVERLEVTGGEGIYSTAPHTRVVDCVVNFKCPNTAGAYGSGIYVKQNSLVQNCSVNGQVGDDSSYLTRGIFLDLSGGNESTSIGIGNRAVNCYVGGEGGLFIGGEMDTCTTGVKCTNPRGGAAFVRFTSCTTPFDDGGGVAPINVENHFDGTDQWYDSSTSYQESDSATPTFTVDNFHDTFICKMTYDGTVSLCTISADAMGGFKGGKKIRIIFQTTADVDGVTSLSWDTDITTTDSDPTLVASTWALSDFVVTVGGTGEIFQITAWNYGTAVVF